MEKYIGCKVIQAHSMSRLDYNVLRDCTVERDGLDSDAGYLVEFGPQMNANNKDVNEYTHWIPKEDFDRYYDVNSNMTFGHAVELLKTGVKVSRQGWNGKGMFLFLVDGSTFKVNRPPLLGIYKEGTEIKYCPHIDMKTADGSIVPWLASQSDVLSNDWMVVPDKDM